jgi:hypothetical protein
VDYIHFGRFFNILIWAPCSTTTISPPPPPTSMVTCSLTPIYSSREPKEVWKVWDGGMGVGSRKTHSTFLLCSGHHYTFFSLFLLFLHIFFLFFYTFSGQLMFSRQKIQHLCIQWNSFNSSQQWKRHQCLLSYRNSVWEPARVARFFLVHDTQTGKMYQIKRKCTKLSYNIPNVPKYS